MDNSSKENNRIQELEEKIKDLKSQMPKHSVSPAMILRLEELEEALAEAKKLVGTIRG